MICENDLIEIKNDSKSGTIAYKSKFPFNEKLINVHYLKVLSLSK
jgi:hypothetical protein